MAPGRSEPARRAAWSPAVTRQPDRAAQHGALVERLPRHRVPAARLGPAGAVRGPAGRRRRVPSCLLTLVMGQARELARAPWRDVWLLGALGVAAPVFLLVAGPEPLRRGHRRHRQHHPAADLGPDELVPGRPAAGCAGRRRHSAGDRWRQPRHRRRRGRPGRPARRRDAGAGVHDRLDLVLARCPAPAGRLRRPRAQRPHLRRRCLDRGRGAGGRPALWAWRCPVSPSIRPTSRRCSG